MSESRGRSDALADRDLLDGVLAAIQRPAFVCDRDGVVVAYNDRLPERTALAPAALDEAALADVVDCETDPLDRVFDAGGGGADGAGDTDGAGDAGSADGTGDADGTITATATVAVDDAAVPCSVTCRPLGGGDAVGAVVTLTLPHDGASESSDRVGTDDVLDTDGTVEAVDHEGADTHVPTGADWPLVAASMEGDEEYGYVVDTDGFVRALDETATGRADRPRAEIVGEDVAVLAAAGVLESDAVGALRDRIAALAATDRTGTTFNVRTGTGGQERVVEHRLTALEHDGDTVGAVGRTRDVTERVRTTDALRESRNRLSTIVENLPVIMFVIGEDGTIEHYQGKGIDRIPYDRDEILGANMDAFEAEFPDIYEGAVRALDGEFLERTVPLDDRTFKCFFEPLDSPENPSEMIGTAVDITERRARERELERREEELRAVVESSPDPIVMKDADGTYQLVNEARVAISEHSRAELVGSKPEDIYDPDVAERIRERTAAVHEAETPRTVEETYFTAEGERTFLTTRAPYYGPDGDLQGTVVLSRDITERRERERELERREEELRAVVESSPDPIVMKDRDGTYQLVNEAKVEMSGHSRDELVGSKPEDIYDPETAAQIRAWTDAVHESGEPETVEETQESGRTLLSTRAPYYGPDGEMEGTVVLSRDITERKRQQDQLERLSRIQHLIHDSVGALTAATTRDEIEATVCDRLATSPFYEFAWIGSRDLSSHEVTPETHAGIDDGYLDTITVTVDPSDSGQGPVGRAYRSGEVTVVEDVDADPDFELWRDAALEAGFRSVAAVPLIHGSTTHGVLVVYADRPNAFSDRELAGFETLGETVGFALSAAQNRRLLESGTALELEFLTRHADEAIRSASATHDCRFVFEGAVDASDEATLCYLTVEDLDLAIATDVLTAADDVERFCSLDGSGPDFEVTIRDGTYQSLADAGARATRTVVENGVSRIFAEGPADTDARSVHDALETVAADVELVARRETDPSDSPWFPAQCDPGARLTDRQRSVLRAAFYSGYYEWPRETDAETLADSLDIATSTMLQHLRKGHRRVMSSLFDS